MKSIAWVFMYPLWCVLRMAAIMLFIPFWIIILLMECVAPDFNRMKKTLSPPEESTTPVEEREDDTPL